MKTNYTIMRDTDTNNWFFSVLDINDDIIYESDANYETEDEVDLAAEQWILANIKV